MANKKENALVKVVNSRPLAPVTEIGKLFWKITSLPLNGPAKRFAGGYNYAVNRRDADPVAALTEGYKEAFFKCGDDFLDTGISVLSGFAGVAGGITAGAFLAPVISGALGATGLAAGIVTGVTAVLAAPVVFVLAPVVAVAVSAGLCASVAAVWSAPIGFVKGLGRMLHRTREEKAIAKMKREAKKKKFDVHVIDRDAPGGLPVAGALTQKHDKAQAAKVTAVYPATSKQEVRYEQQ